MRCFAAAVPPMLTCFCCVLTCPCCPQHPPILIHVQPVGYLGCAAMTGVMCMAVAWVLFDFTEDPPDGGNFSSPR